MVENLWCCHLKHFPCKARGKTAEETNPLLHGRQKHPSGLQITDPTVCPESLTLSFSPPAAIISLLTKQAI